jgi:hypothetical protein
MLRRATLPLVLLPLAWSGHSAARPQTASASASSTAGGERAQGNLEGYLFHFKEAPNPAGLVDLTRGTLMPCPPEVRANTPPCWKVRPVAGDPTTWEAVPAGGKDALRDPRALGTAWDEAYRLREQSGAERVEPVLELDDSARAAASFSAGDRPHKPEAQADSEWSLKHINVHTAWSLLRQGGRADGEEGKGIGIAHLDTGYREHRELWDPDEAKSPVLFKHGYDFLQDDDKPFDDMETGGTVPNPGHGTKSGSVIVSAKGKQWTGGGPKDFVSGVAPGARLIPLRVHRSVVHFNPARLAKAITEAAGSDRTHVKAEAQVMSLSLGGAPSFGLWKAVRFAKSRGVIVVAAAGNEVGFVVWPARFKETVAVAASNVLCGVWEGSSRGAAVDITAPGESVWRAETSPAGVDGMGMGQGTTFATAITAGVAALWLDHQRTNPLIAQLRQQGKLTDAFREVLRQTAWQPDGVSPPGVTCPELTPWDTDKLGAGMVDVGRALTMPVPAAPPSRELEGDATGGLPLFASLFEPAVPAAKVLAAYRRLLGIEGERAVGQDAELEGEITLHYAQDAEVRRSLDTALAASAPPEAFTRAREVLRSRDVSARLRKALGG